MDEKKCCIHCGREIRKITYALGGTWMHVVPEASFPTEQRGTAWRYCKNTVATPPWPGPEE